MTRFSGVTVTSASSFQPVVFSGDDHTVFIFDSLGFHQLLTTIRYLIRTVILKSPTPFS